MKRELVVAAISLGIVVALAGCGGPGDAPEEETDDDPSEYPPDETGEPTDDEQLIDDAAGYHADVDGDRHPSTHLTIR